MENTVAHELIHAYDQCRAGKRMNWSDVRQHACSEVRAANLSGDCHWVNEVMRGKVFAGLKGHHRKARETRRIVGGDESKVSRGETRRGDCGGGVRAVFQRYRAVR